MLVEDFNHTIDTWIKELEPYKLEQLCVKPAPDSWSLGQLYMHLIESTHYFIEQIKICLASNENALGEALPQAREMFHNNAFPDILIEGPPSNALTPNPESKKQIELALMDLKEEVRQIETLITHSPFKGKTRHPGLKYFNAGEWLQFAEMHLRHHLRQKDRIVAVLMRDFQI